MKELNIRDATITEKNYYLKISWELSDTSTLKVLLPMIITANDRKTEYYSFDVYTQHLSLYDKYFSPAEDAFKFGIINPIEKELNKHGYTLVW